jgi:hypothetical protein
MSLVEKSRGEHFQTPELFAAYYDAIAAGPDMWTEQSRRLEGWQQLEALGLMQSGGW